MKVIACPSDYTGCGHYRILQPAAALADSETTVEVEVAEGIPVHTDNLGRITEIPDLECDVLVLQRPLHHWIPQAMVHIQRQGIAVVVEVDDDLHSLHSRNGVYHAVHPRTSPQMNWQHLAKCCGLADLVTVSTPALAERYGAHGRVVVLPNYVSGKWLDIEHAGDGNTVGWAGVVGVHPDDLQVTRGGVALAVEDCDARFLCVGNGELVERNLSLQRPPEITGYLPLEEYPHHIARFDVGIVPLADTRFNAAKSWLKGLEMAACGVPFVASPMREYRALAALDIGVLVEGRSRSWRREIRSMLQDPAWRDELAGVARKRVREELTIEDNAWRWAEAWDSTLVPA